MRLTAPVQAPNASVRKCCVFMPMPAGTARPVTGLSATGLGLGPQLGLSSRVLRLTSYIVVSIDSLLRKVCCNS